MNNNDKLILNTALLRKESEFRTKSCMVEKAIAVSHAEFDDLKRHPLRDNKMIAENAELGLRVTRSVLLMSICECLNMVLIFIILKQIQIVFSITR